MGDNMVPGDDVIWMMSDVGFFFGICVFIGLMWRFGAIPCSCTVAWERVRRTWAERLMFGAAWRCPYCDRHVVTWKKAPPSRGESVDG